MESASLRIPQGKLEVYDSMPRERKELRPPSEKHSHFYRQCERVQIGDTMFTYLSGLRAANWGAHANVRLRRVCSIAKLTDDAKELSHSA